MPTVGVVIPIYRSGAYVEGCLESVLAQRRPVDEIVLVDDCGGDDSIDVATSYLKAHDRSFILITQPRNGGLGRARNTGLRALDTELVWFLDSDDRAHPDFLEEAVGAMERTGADFAVTRTERVDGCGNVLQIDEAPVLGELVTGDAYARELLCGRAKAYACTKVFRRRALGDRPWAQDQAYEDIATSLRVAMSSGSVAMIDRPLYHYLYREGSLSTALTRSTLDLFVVDEAVAELVAAKKSWRRDHLGFRYREVLTSVAHVAMRADHAAATRPDLYDVAIGRVRREIDLRDISELYRGGYRREIVFALLVKLVPQVYSAVLRRR